MSRILDDPRYSPEQRAINQMVVAYENASQVARDAEMNRLRAIEQEKKDVELQKQGELHRIQRKKEIEAEAKRFKEQSAVNLEAALRERFFRKNSEAREEDYERVKDRLKDEYFLERMKGQQTVEQLFAQTSLKM